MPDLTPLPLTQRPISNCVGSPLPPSLPSSLPLSNLELCLNQTLPFKQELSSEKEIVHKDILPKELLSKQELPIGSSSEPVNSLDTPRLSVKTEQTSPDESSEILLSEHDEDVVEDTGHNVCSNCTTTKTPLWRRAPDGTLICNACGLYLRSNNHHRPVNLKRPPNTVAISTQGGSCKGDGSCNGMGGSPACEGCPAYDNRIFNRSSNPTHTTRDELQVQSPEQFGQLAVACFNCHSTITPLWRRDDIGNTICNACGLYFKLHGKHRPTKMKRDTIKRRKRTPNLFRKMDGPLNGLHPRIESPAKLRTSDLSDPRDMIGSQNENETLTKTDASNSTNEYYLRSVSPPAAQIVGYPVNQQSNTQPVPPLLHQALLGVPPINHYNSGIPNIESYYPPYSGFGKVPNGPGPLPGPPPPGSRHLVPPFTSFPLPRTSSPPLVRVNHSELQVSRFDPTNLMRQKNPQSELISRLEPPTKFQKLNDATVNLSYNGNSDDSFSSGALGYISGHGESSSRRVPISLIISGQINNLESSPLSAKFHDSVKPPESGKRNILTTVSNSGSPSISLSSTPQRNSDNTRKGDKGDSININISKPEDESKQNKTKSNNCPIAVDFTSAFQIKAKKVRSISDLLN